MASVACCEGCGRDFAGKGRFCFNCRIPINRQAGKHRGRHDTLSPEDTAWQSAWIEYCDGDCCGEDEPGYRKP